MPSQQIPITLVFPAMLHGRPHKGVADCLCRITKTQIVVESGSVRDNASVRLGALPYRFTHQGRRIGHGNWRIAAGEIERLQKVEAIK